MFKAFEFCLPISGKEVPDRPEWLHEVKYDGYRFRVEREGDRVRLITRGGYDWTKRYPWIVESALKNRIRQSQRRTSRRGKPWRCVISHSGVAKIRGEKRNRRGAVVLG